MKLSTNILGIDIDSTTLKDAKSEIEKFLKEDKIHTIYTPNTEIVMESREDEKLKDILNRGDMVIPDGIGLIYASKIRKKNLKERVTGYDISIEMLDIANENGYSIYLLGCAEGVADKAGDEILKKYSNIKVVGKQNGFFKGAHIGQAGHEEELNIIEDINNSKADILFVGLGAPKQEYWIDENKDKLKIKVAIGNGGTMNIIAGTMKRAPEIFQKLGLEWLYRLIKEPSRLKRQLALPKFMITVLLNKNSVQ